MYEHQTFQTILNRMLSRVPADVDKREGSIIYDALAPAALELTEMYFQLDTNLNLSLADTSSGEFLERRTAEFGVEREKASKARRKGLFYGNADVPADVPVGSRFGAGDLRYAVVRRIAAGVFELECETAGVTGNHYFGALLPIDYIAGLVRAELADVLVPGEDEETDEALRKRFFQGQKEKPFGGNVADYKQKIGNIPGVGGVKIFPAWQGGGTVKCTLLGSDFNPPSAALIEEVQTAIDPSVNQGKGWGLAPMGHTVTIDGVQNVKIDVETTITLGAGVTVGQVQGEIEAAISSYLLGLRQTWAEESQLIVRISQIDARILTVSGVNDVKGTRLNGETANITLSTEKIPQMGTVKLHV
ncbi:baseplate J/gp47 family protein [Paenibacillus elgii]|uniref:baseplate J/gp47 family protein n=1 Tax=Paenibacillus elgii TaxID=189691 RepID=UPI0013D6A494|nr:baseplate J/gp47 family protein [Paenibacillus elgii]